MALLGAHFSALFSSHGALDMTQLTRTLAHSARETRKTASTASVAVFLLSGLLSGVALADTIFKHGGHTYKIVTEPASWADASERAGAMTLGSNVGYLARIDSGSEPVMTWGFNDADDGICTIPGFYISGGGLWLGDAHIATFDLRLPVPKRDDASGVALFMNAPKGLAKGDVVALDASARLSVIPVKGRLAKVPFVVAKVDEKQRTFVMARGLAWVKVTGEVKPGDILVTSAKSLRAEADNENTDPSRSLGVAVSEPVGNKVLARIGRIARGGD